MTDNKKPRIFDISEEAPTTETQLVIPPRVECSLEVQEACPYKDSATGCFEDRHHLYWEGSNYSQAPFRGLRALGQSVVKICRRAHDELHVFQLPSSKPTVDVARAAIVQAGFNDKITETYVKIQTKKDALKDGTVKKPHKVEREITALFDEIDRSKELRGIHVRKTGVILPSVTYTINLLGGVEFEQGNES